MERMVPNIKSIYFYETHGIFTKSILYNAIKYFPKVEKIVTQNLILWLECNLEINNKKKF